MSDPQTVVAGLYEAFGKGDLEKVFATIGDDIVWHLPGPEKVIPYAGLRHGRRFGRAGGRRGGRYGLDWLCRGRTRQVYDGQARRPRHVGRRVGCGRRRCS